MEILDKQLEKLIEKLDDHKSFYENLHKIKTIYPFNKFEYTISKLLAKKLLSWDDYVEIRDDYIFRNLYIHVFEISAPRGFGDGWAFSHLIEQIPTLKKPSKTLDHNYSQQYDLCLDWVDVQQNNHLIKIEVKASRAVDKNRPDEPLYTKALDSESELPFLMNFQQLKPNCADVFIWIAVYSDLVKYWVLSAKAVQNNRNFTPQHRNAGTSAREKDYDSSGIFEGQIMVTNQNISEFDGFLTTNKSLEDKIIEQYKSQIAQK
jgi:hypothetical protein